MGNMGSENQNRTVVVTDFSGNPNTNNKEQNEKKTNINRMHICAEKTTNIPG